MKSWDPDKYLSAWNFASEAHRDQLLHTCDIPYINHLGSVAMESLAAIQLDYQGLIQQPDLLVQCALLHDTIEDTDVDHRQLLTLFGAAVADGVQALTKNPDLVAKRQMPDSLERILLQPKEIWMVKLADRITNLQVPPRHWDIRQKQYYSDEAQLIVKTLGKANPQLAKRLACKIDCYQKYLR